VDLEVAPTELLDVAAFVAAQQADPAHHIGYLHVDAGPILEQLAGLEPVGTAGLVVATDGGRLVGVLAAEWDDAPPRCWWHGPFVAEDADWRTVGDALLARARTLLPATVTQEELAGDGRHAWLAAFAERHGFADKEASAVLVRTLGDDLAEPAAAMVSRSALTAAQRDQVAVLHDALFPGTHTTGRRLVADADNRLLATLGEAGQVVGYVAVERQEDGSGYVDFLGVGPDDRGRGLGTHLVAAACRELRDALGCREAHLTMRVGNAVARRVYARNGFAEERLLVPYCRGFDPA